jgi:Pyruvate-formate lyase
MVFKSHQILGENTGATPDGRLACTALSDSVGAVQGMDRKGLTALFRSVTRTDFVPAVGGVTFNVRLMPSLFNSEELLNKLTDAVITYFDLGGLQIQVNVVDGSVLRDAKKNPQKHGDLIVRVGGFSAYFTALSPVIQNEIILRTEHGVG